MWMWAGARIAVRRVAAVSRPEVLARFASIHEFVEHAVQGAERDRQVTFAFFQMRREGGRQATGRGRTARSDRRLRARS